MYQSQLFWCRLRWETLRMPKLQTCITRTAVLMVTVELQCECITHSFLIEECWITEFFSGYIVNSVKHVRSASPDVILVDEALSKPEIKHLERCG
ncbi:hypothetical protein TNCV_4607181 [Trichonephila clavipes]|nr:hypothetical protein TNCV_4607181 [Trichonephila clavipes]